MRLHKDRIHRLQLELEMRCKNQITSGEHQRNKVCDIPTTAEKVQKKT